MWTLGIYSAKSKDDFSFKVDKLVCRDLNGRRYEAYFLEFDDGHRVKIDTFAKVIEASKMTREEIYTLGENFMRTNKRYSVGNQDFQYCKPIRR